MSVLFTQREGDMFGKAWELGNESVTSFINDGALSRGAAIAFYAVTSIGPVLLIVDFWGWSRGMELLNLVSSRIFRLRRITE
jgi:uncharacterized BrkB/YihY/UPF0761 family membrane protein